MPIKVKEEHLKTVVGFNDSAKPLGERKDLHKLVRAADQNETLLDYFEELPDDDELKKLEQDELDKKQKSRRSINKAAEAAKTAGQGNVTETTNPSEGK